jgi:hypothetical protein
MALSATEVPSVAEINLRRLLAVCEKQAASKGLIRGSDKLKFVTVCYSASRYATYPNIGIKSDY